jgi:hypothetical protein
MTWNCFYKTTPRSRREKRKEKWKDKLAQISFIQGLTGKLLIN